ncbi:unnamed protein product, partial [Rhizophagus irregularis]
YELKRKNDDEDHKVSKTKTDK